MKNDIYKRFLGLDNSLLKEDPDFIELNRNTYTWYDNSTTPFMILSDKNDNSVLIYSTNPLTHKKMLEKIFTALMFHKTTLANIIKNDILQEYKLVPIINYNTELPQIKYEEIGSLIGEYNNNRYDDSLIFGRIWNLDESGIYVSIWENPVQARPYKHLFVDMLQSLDYDVKNSQWEIRNDKIDESIFVSIDDFFNDNTQQKPDVKKAHEIAGMKRELGIDAPGFGSYKQGEIASKVKMPFAQYHAMVNQESTEYEL